MSQPSSVAVNPISIVGAQYCVPNPVDLTIVRNDPTAIEEGNFFGVFDANGNLNFKVKSDKHWYRLDDDTCKLLDSAGNPLLCMHEKKLTAHRRYKVYRGNSKDEKDLLFSVKKTSMLQSKASTKLRVFLASNTNKDVCDFMIKGSLLKRPCTVYRGDSTNILAQLRITKKVQLQKESDDFMVTVYPHIDYAFMVALIVIFIKIDEDRNYEEKNEDRNHGKKNKGENGDTNYEEEDEDEEEEEEEEEE